eukprot:CAMPEP_0175121884 /NCGR_PEP_ID=MMETSP0087-20121206/1411_1 /TAXON_ID=136419 /ORGANISM="Unknown Unknown, Strain D1" /LENGTH=585 /DNA_ID=CAMNT_0016403465 /DNA_START=24 /DNA_END=1777 /DNA_ORIENTATION=+
MVVMKVLNVAEKPSVAKEISAILGGARLSKRSGFSPYNCVWEFKSQLNGQHCDMLFTSVSGHLMEMEFESSVKSWHSCDPLRLFDAAVSKGVDAKRKPLQQTLQREARKCQWLILWLDCDREGENIAFEVVDVCKQVKPSLQVLRARFSALIPRDIQQAMQTLGQPNPHLSDAVDCRSEIDLRIGAAFTRFQTLRLQSKFAELADTLISYGPCQFPTLGFVVERYLKREAFVPEPFWKISCSYTHQTQTAEFVWERKRLFDRQVCAVLFETVVEEGEAVVTATHRRETRRRRPKPLNTVDMQKLAASKLRMSSHRAMEVAEALYQRGILSYPRTETQIFKEGTDLAGLIDLQRQSGLWGSYASGLLNDNKYLEPDKSGQDDNAHPPIHPTQFAGQLTGEEAKLYELVCRHFLACCSHDAIGQQTTVRVRVGEEGFTCSGLMVTDRNYLEVYTYDEWRARQIPVFSEGQRFAPSSLRMEEGTTVAPLLLKEADLIALMDSNGIGTDATIAQHIQTIKDRGYVEEKQQYYWPTDLGVGLVKGYDAMGLSMSQPNLRAHIEHQISLVAAGQLSKAEVLSQCLADMRSV